MLPKVDLYGQNINVVMYVDSIVNLIQTSENKKEKEINAKKLFNWVVTQSMNSDLPSEDTKYLDKITPEIYQLSYDVSRDRSKINKDSIRALEKKLARLNNEIKFIQDTLISIVSNVKVDTDVKHYAVSALAKIHNDDVLDFLFKKEENLWFGDVKSNADPSEIRSAMKAIIIEYFGRKGNYWTVIPYIIKYFKYDLISEIGMISILARNETNEESKKQLLLFLKSSENPVLFKIIDEYFSEEID